MHGHMLNELLGVTWMNKQIIVIIILSSRKVFGTDVNVVLMYWVGHAVADI